MKRNILLIINLLFAFFVNAQVSKTVNVTTAGTLRTLFTTTEMTSVSNLTVTGSIDARDFKLIRDGIINLAVLDISEVTIQTYNGTGGTSNVTSYPSNEIPEYSFYNNNTGQRNTTLKTIAFPNSVTSIGDSAFYYCTGLAGSLTIPNSVTTIGNHAFYFCTSLTSVTIPNSVTFIGDYAFWFCSGLTSLTIPNSVTSIGEYVFFGCSGLTSINIPNSVTSIGNFAFGSCKSLTSLTISNSVISIGDYAFNYSKLISLNIPNSVRAIGNQAFYGCIELTSISIPNSVNYIGNLAFGGCTGLTSIHVYATIPIVLSSGAFNSVNVYACTLYVPAGSISAYQSAPIWGDFNIVEMAPNALPTLALESVNIYPNPVTDGFYANGLEGTGVLILTDLSGKVLLTKQVETNDYVSVGYLPKGVYIVNITTANGTIERKVIKK